MKFKCSRCDAEVEDKGLCVQCWDKQVAAEARAYKQGSYEKRKASRRAYQQRYRAARKRGCNVST